MVNENHRNDSSPTGGLTDLNITAPSPPTPDAKPDAKRGQAREQSQGLENQSVTQPPTLDAPEKQ